MMPTSGVRPIRRALAPVLMLLAAASGGLSCSDSLSPDDRAKVASIAVDPPNPTVGVGGEITLEATVQDAEGNVLTGRQVFWTSEDETMATISPQGVVTGLVPGSVRIAVSSEGVSTLVTLVIGAKPVAEVELTPATAEVVVGGTRQLQATTLASDGSTLSGRQVAWTTANPDIATVDANGLVSAIAPGVARITATSEGESAVAIVTVVRTSVDVIEISPPSPSLVVGQTTQLTATLRAPGGGVLTDRNVTWNSSRPDVATVSSTGLVTALAPGQASITATSEGKSASTTVTVTPKPVSSVIVSPSATSVVAGQSVGLSAQVTDASGNVLPGRPITWSSNNTSIATVSAQGVVTGVSPGSATITATSEGRSGTATVTVTPVPVATVEISPPNPSLVVGETQQLTVTTKDAAGRTLTGRTVTWSSSNGGVATVSATGLLTAVGPGSTVIRAVSEGVNGFATVTVAQVPVASVAISAPTTNITVGQTVQLSATPRDRNGAPLSGRSVVWTSSDDNVASVTSTGLVRGISAGSATITATSEGKSANVTITVSQVPVASVDVTPKSPSISVGQTTQLTATVKDQSGNTLTGRAVSWSSNNTAVATVDANGLVRGVGPGSATITATSEGKTGSTTVTVSPAPVGAVVVSPSTATLTVGGTQALTVRITDAQGQELTGRPVSWSSEHPQFATVSSSGVVTAVAPGTATIRATSEGKTGTATIVVNAVPVGSVEVTPSGATLIPGEKVDLDAVVKDASGNPISGRSVSWSSTNASVATVDQSGVVTAVAPGDATIIAASGGQSDFASIHVNPTPVASVDVSAPSSSLQAGTTMQLSATPKSASGQPLSGRDVSWSSSNTAIATVSSTGLVTGVEAGPVTITARSEGQSGSVSLTVTPRPVASVEVEPSSLALEVGEAEPLTVTARDASGGELFGREATWTTSNASVATVSPSGVVTAQGPGTASITATIEGKSDAATVTVTAAPVASVTVTPNPATVTEGGTVQLSAELRDERGNVLTGRDVTWSSNNTAVATVDGNGLVTAVAPGDATITARSEGESGTATVNVQPAPVASVEVTAPSGTLEVGSTMQLTATTRSASGAILTGRTVEWGTTNADVATVSNTGLVTAKGPGTVAIGATSEGKSGGVVIQVTEPPVASVTLAADSQWVEAGRTLPVTATLRDARNNVLTGRPVSWQSGNATIADVTSAGVVHAHQLGTVPIVATADGVSGAIEITVTVAAIELRLRDDEIKVGETARLDIRLLDAAGARLQGADIVWSSSDSAVAVVERRDDSWRVRGVSPGTATIRVSAYRKESNPVVAQVEAED